MWLACGSLLITTQLSLLANEFDVQSILHGQVSLAALNQICIIHEAMNGCINLDSLKACFENVNISIWLLNHLCRLLITFANSLLGLIWIQTVWHWWYSWKNFSKKLILKKISRRQKIMQNYPGGKALSIGVFGLKTVLTLLRVSANDLILSSLK